jgi:hypothetical protein
MAHGFISSWSPNDRIQIWGASNINNNKEYQGTNTSELKKSNDRGKLLCCLKVEIRTGVYKRLPVHQVKLYIFTPAFRMTMQKSFPRLSANCTSWLDQGNLSKCTYNHQSRYMAPQINPHAKSFMLNHSLKSDSSNKDTF